MTTKSSNKNENPLYISRRSRRGVYVFVLCCLALVYAPRIVLFMNPSDDSILTTEEITYFHETHKNTVDRKSKEFKSKGSKYKVPPEKFDPATYSTVQWMNLGLSEKQANVVVKFASRGIRNEEQLKQIFVIPDQLFSLIKDSVIYTLPKVYEKSEKDITKNEIILIELNTATKEDLEKLKGIGPYLSSKIVNFRTQLGGFHQVEQLVEVYKFPPELMETIQKFLKLDPSMIRKLNINSATTEELNAHPYLNWNQANSIVKIRQQKVKFTSLEQLKESVLIDEKTYKKILPYVTL